MGWLPTLLAIAVGATVLELVRRRRLREEFSWLWLVGTAIAVVLSVARARSALAGAMHLSEGALVGGASSLFLALLSLDLSTKVSRLTTQQKNLAQGLARMEKRLADLEADERQGR